MPKPAAARTTSAAIAPPAIPNLCFFATAATAELLVWAAWLEPLPGGGTTLPAGETALTPPGDVLELASEAASISLGAPLWLDSESRFRRCRSARISAACWERRVR